jgi:hypothetical protein
MSSTPLSSYISFMLLAGMQVGAGVMWGLLWAYERWFYQGGLKAREKRNRQETLQLLGQILVRDPSTGRDL